MTINTTKNEKECLITVEGRIDTLTAPELQQVLMDNAQSSDKIILDLSEVVFISSAGLRVLVFSHREMSKKSGLVLRGVNKNVRAVINMTGFNKILNIED